MIAVARATDCDFQPCGLARSDHRYMGEARGVVGGSDFKAVVLKFDSKRTLSSLIET